MKKYVRLISLFLILAMLANFLTGCFFRSGEEEAEFVIPYEENYLINKLKPTETNYYEEFTYTDQNSEAMYMGGYPYHGGFLLRTQDLIEEKNSSYAVFDVSEYAGKTLSFVMGSACINGYQDSYYAIVSVQLDGEQVIDELVYSYSTAKRYTLDLTGKSELKFLIREGCNDVYIAEMTVWDGEPAVTGHTPDTSKNKVQLIKDLLPYLWQMTDYALYTEAKIEEGTEEFKALEAYMTTYYAKKAFTYEPAVIAGKSYYEAFTAQMSMPISGEDVNTFYFNAEGQYRYLTFSAGTLNVENKTPGSSWVSVYADGKRVHEELVSSDSLPETYTVDIGNAEVVKFEFKYSEGGTHTVAVYDAVLGKSEGDLTVGDNSDISSLPDVCKLISNIPPYLVASHVEEPLYDGSTQYRTFSMAGRKYNEGIALLASNSFLMGNTGAHICFNLEGEFKYLTFVAGILDKTQLVKDETLHIYLDGELSQSIKLSALSLPQEYTIELKNCKELKMELAGSEMLVRPTFGLANMVVYRNEVTENDLFPAPENNYPNKMPLVENIKPYITYVSNHKSVDSSLGNYTDQVVFDGSTKQEYFTINGEKKYAGFLLQTSVHMDLIGVFGGTNAADALIAEMIVPFVMPGIAGGAALLAADVAAENSFAMFDLQGQFKKVTFTVADTGTVQLAGMSTTDKLLIGTDDTVVKEITVTKGMKPTTYTVEIENTEQLVFWLACDDGTSSEFAIYDIVVEK